MNAFSFALRAQGRPALLYETYHENSKLNILSDSRALTAEEVYITSRSARGTAGANTTPAHYVCQLGLDDLIRRRRSSRELNSPVDFTDLAGLLWAANGVTGSLEENDGPLFGLRSTPSAGGLYPIDIYLVARQVDGVHSGVYYFHPFKEELQLLHDSDPERVADVGFFSQPFILSASVIFVLVASFQRTTWKYGERGYRLCLLDAGHLAQNLILKATELYCPCVPVAGFHDDLLARELKLDAATEAVVHAVVLGGRANGV